MEPIETLLRRAFGQIGDLLFPIFATLASVAYRQPLEAMGKFSKAGLELAGDRLQRFWGHTVAIGVRALVKYALAFVVGVQLLVLWYCKNHVPGFSWDTFYVWLAGAAPSCGLLFWNFILLYRVKDYTAADRRVLYSQSFFRDTDPDQPGNGKLISRTRVREYVRQVRDIEKRVGDPSERNVKSYFSIAFAFLAGSVSLGLMAAWLFNNDHALREQADFPLFFSILFLLLGVATVMAAIKVVGGVLEVVGGYAAKGLQLFIWLLLIAAPFITRENLDERLGKLRKVSTPDLSDAKELFSTTIGVVALVIALYINLLDPLYTFIALPVSLAALKAGEMALKRAFSMDTSKLLLGLTFKAVLSVLTLYHIFAIALRRFYGWEITWTERDASATFHTIIAMVQGIMGIAWHYASCFSIFFLLVGVAFLLGGLKSTKKVWRATFFGMAILHIAVVLLFLYGGLWSAKTGQTENQIRAFGLEGPPVVAADAGTPAASQGIVSAMSAGERGR
jgi:hypothetical protein